MTVAQGKGSRCNKEKSYKKYLESQCSDQWRKHLELTLSDPPGRVRAYLNWHLHNKHKRIMYKPAPYLTHLSCPYQLELLRICTQHTILIIPSHLHYAFRAPRAHYQDRVCPHCLDKGSATVQVIGIKKVQRDTRRHWETRTEVYIS